MKSLKGHPCAVCLCFMLWFETIVV